LSKGGSQTVRNGETGAQLSHCEHQPRAATDRAFRKAIQTFRRMSPKEIRETRP